MHMTCAIVQVYCLYSWQVSWNQSMTHYYEHNYLLRLISTFKSSFSIQPSWPCIIFSFDWIIDYESLMSFSDYFQKFIGREVYHGTKKISMQETYSILLWFLGTCMNTGIHMYANLTWAPVSLSCLIKLWTNSSSSRQRKTHVWLDELQQ
jgi:hypothetical protein